MTKKTIPLDIIIKLTVTGAAALGLVIGALFVFGSDVLGFSEGFSRLFGEGNVYLIRTESESSALFHFIGRALVYIQPMLIIWFLAFLPPMFFLTPALLLAQSLGIAYSAALVYNTMGAADALLLLGPQIFIVLPALVYISAGSARQAAGRARARKIAFGGVSGIRLKGRETEYGTKLLLGLLAAVAAAFIETWII